MVMAAATMTCIKNWRYPGGHDGTGGMHHHRVLHDHHRPRYFGKVGMRYFHHPRNKFYCPTVGIDRFWSLGPYDVKNPATACDDDSAPLIGVTPFNYSDILGRNALTGCFRY